MRPVVYPSWWGDDAEKEAEGAANLRSKVNKSPKRLRSADPVKARYNNNVARYGEDDLDRRLREV